MTTAAIEADAADAFMFLYRQDVGEAIEAGLNARAFGDYEDLSGRSIGIVVGHNDPWAGVQAPIEARAAVAAGAIDVRIVPSVLGRRTLEEFLRTWPVGTLQDEWRSSPVFPGETGSNGGGRR